MKILYIYLEHFNILNSVNINNNYLKKIIKNKLRNQKKILLI